MKYFIRINYAYISLIRKPNQRSQVEKTKYKTMEEAKISLFYFPKGIESALWLLDLKITWNTCTEYLKKYGAFGVIFLPLLCVNITHIKNWNSRNRHWIETQNIIVIVEDRQIGKKNVNREDLIWGCWDFIFQKVLF